MPNSNAGDPRKERWRRPHGADAFYNTSDCQILRRNPIVFPAGASAGPLRAGRARSLSRFTVGPERAKPGPCWLMYKTLLVFLVLMLGLGLGLGLGLAQDKAPPKELIQYIHDARKAGLNDSQIQQNAVKAGWSPAVVGEAIATPPGDAKPVSNDPPPATSEAAPARPANPAMATWEPANNPASLTTMTRPDSGTKTAAPETERLKTASTSGVAEDYRIGEGDVLQINVLGEQTASVPSVVVRTDGKISMPLIKEVAVSGLTPPRWRRSSPSNSPK